jgi:hypothetical protein
LLERARAKKFFGFGLHDCYAGLWLERYPQLLHKLAQIGDFVSADQLCDWMFLTHDGAAAEPGIDTGKRRAWVRVADWLLPSSP